MRVIEWNCQGAFRKKNQRILAYMPDILIIPECESDEKLAFGQLTPKPTDFFWYSTNESKGIGVFSYSDYKFELLKEFNPKFRYIIPLKVSNETDSFLLFAIWAMDNKDDPRARYIAQIWLAINYYSHLLNSKSILIGDFNSNQIWDDNSRLGNHSDVVELLRTKQIYSLYHKQTSLKHGDEDEHTFFMYRKKEKAYHIDYCFVSKDFIEEGAYLQIGNPEEWLDLSDHIPLFLDVKTPMGFCHFENSLKSFVDKKSECLNAVTLEKFSSEIDQLKDKAIYLDQKATEIEDRLLIIDTVEKLLDIDSRIVEMKENGF